MQIIKSLSKNKWLYGWLWFYVFYMYLKKIL